MSFFWQLFQIPPLLKVSTLGTLPPRTEDSRLLDPKVKTYLPAVGGLTIYTFGDARKLKDEKTEVMMGGGSGLHSPGFCWKFLLFVTPSW